MDRPIAPIPQVEQLRQTGERRFGDGTLHVEQEDRFGRGRPLFRQAEPSGLTHPLRAASDVAVPDEVDVDVRFVGRPMLLKIEQEVRPISWKAVLLEVFDGEREAVVDANDGRRVSREFLAKPFSKTTPRPIQPGARWRLNLYRFAGASRPSTSEPIATGVRRLRARVVDADVAFKLCHASSSGLD